MLPNALGLLFNVYYVHSTLLYEVAGRLYACCMVYTSMYPWSATTTSYFYYSVHMMYAPHVFIYFINLLYILLHAW